MSFKINTLLFSCLLVALFVIAPAMSSPRLMTLKFPCDDYAVAAVVATDPAYGALGDGKTDCTASIQAAIRSGRRVDVACGSDSSRRLEGS